MYKVKNVHDVDAGEVLYFLPDGHWELPGGALTLSDQEGPTLPVPEPTLRHAARYTAGKPAAYR